MRKLKFILPVALIALVVSISLTSCEQREDWRFPELGNGGFVKFVQQPFSEEGTDNSDGTTIVKYHIGVDPAAASFNAFIEDPSGNVAKVDYIVIGDFENAPEEGIQFASTTSLPFDVSFTTDDMASLFGVDASTFKANDFFEFLAVITTHDGTVYIPRAAACDCPDIPFDPADPDPLGTGEYNGGTIDGVVLMGGDTGENFLLPAIWYRVYYRAPSN